MTNEPEPRLTAPGDSLPSATSAPSGASNGLALQGSGESTPAATRPAGATKPHAQPAGAPSDERRCEVCGNLYDKAFRVVHGGRSHVFDCFECAIHALAPTCAGCGCRIVGHGMESDGVMYCCAHCAQRSGIDGLKDRADATLPAS